MITIKHPATWRELKQAKLERPPDAGKLWQGVPHIKLVRALLAECGSRGWTAFGQEFAMFRSGAGLIGKINIPDLKSPHGMTYSIGILTDNLGTCSLRLYVGLSVAPTWTGLAFHRIVIPRRDPERFDLEDSLSNAFDEWIGNLPRMMKAVAGLQAWTLSDAEAEHLILEAGRRGLVPWSRLARVDAAWKEPKPSWGGTSWALSNALSSAVAMSPPHQQPERLLALWEMVPAAS